MKLISNHIKFLIITILFSFSFSQNYFDISIESTGVSQLIIFQDSISGLQEGDEIGVFDAQAILNSQDCSFIEFKIENLGKEKIYDSVIANHFKLTGKEVTGDDVNIDICVNLVLFN